MQFFTPCILVSRVTYLHNGYITASPDAGRQMLRASAIEMAQRAAQASGNSLQHLFDQVMVALALVDANYNASL